MAGSVMIMGLFYIYYASGDTRMHLAVTSVERLLDYCLHAFADGLRPAVSVKRITELINKNQAFLKREV